MPLILDRQHVLDIYSEASQKRWVIPCFGSENLTTTEAVLAAALEYSTKTGKPDIPVTIAITNQYSHRSQSANYTHTKLWDIGLKLFCADIEVLTAKGSPFEKLNVMIHLDHTQWDNDLPLLHWDMNKFSMIMYDASTLPFDENIARTAEFVEKHRSEIVIEGACDEIVDATGSEVSKLTTPESAVKYLEGTGADFIVANLGTEHRANKKDLKYHSNLAREISKVTGPKLVLHGTSSVGNDQIGSLYDDGIAKVNIWTALERDSSPALAEEMIKNIAKIVDRDMLSELKEQELLGAKAGLSGVTSLSHYTTVYRQDIIFNKMKEIVAEYFNLWYL
ncbi:MAG: class II fructose-bisphosphate aldolase [Bacteroidales bacterium]|jgi:fructose-bisphosphate aldolase class II|nr:class II fructose-bisphosphate aldolase [Bacteroidales bacterium]